ncbi:DUF560 domain-containing protein [Pseudoalteromonas sp. MMG010]|uniref:DUF2860 family protein n=1 Tax=Pseudoalteromonas sp. MMG010 TaxID=2822685 RepID=UPI001B39D4FD|nr:DUF2860 family protein [Pseudoalteromonas sp. MMG010]MBQ4834215.1 DUF560 domain-containing protein [Pseudoalteromonas sp. MMG010]
MSKRLFQFSLIIYLMFSSTLSYSKTINYDELVNDVKRLIAAQKFQQAYTLSNQHVEFLGEPEFDFLLGIVALKTDHADPAVFAFERVVEANPNWLEARLYLTRAYIAINNLPAAITQANLLINADSASNSIKTSAKNLLSAANNDLGTATVKQSIELALGVDGNVNAGTSEDTIVIPQLGEVLLSSESKSSDDNYILLKYNGQYSAPLTKNSAFSVNAHTQWYKFSELDQYDRLSSRINASYQYKKFNTLWYTKIGITPLFLDGDFYRNESTLTFGAHYQPSQPYSLFSSVSYGALNNVFDEKLDNTFYSVSAGGSYVSGAWFHSLNLNGTSENADLSSGDYNSRDILALYYQANTQLSSQWQLLSLIGYQSINYKTEHPLFLQQRDDNLMMLSGSVRYLVNQDLALKLTANYQTKNSNIALFEYDRLDANLSISYAF